MKTTEKIDVSEFISLTASFTKLSFIENDNCPDIISNMPIVPPVNKTLLFIIKKNI